jgi:hypothetical protein
MWRSLLCACVLFLLLKYTSDFPLKWCWWFTLTGKSLGKVVRIGPVYKHKNTKDGCYYNSCLGNEANIHLAEDCAHCQTIQNRAIHVGCYKTRASFPPAERPLVSNGHCSMQIVSTELDTRPGTPGRYAASASVHYDDRSPSSVLRTTAGSACSSFDFNFDPALRSNTQNTLISITFVTCENKWHPLTKSTALES